jgi:pSer/pThr/pTyr-binding forkhead associated (FHA) protein
MGTLGWNIYLFLSKWVLIIMIYVALLVILLSVRREMALRLGGKDTGDQKLPAPGRLRVIQPGSDTRLQSGQVLNLAQSSGLGCEMDNEVVLDDPYVSGHHARLSWDGVAWWIEDLDSRNGTYLGQERLAAKIPQHLQPGAVLRLGDVELEMVE